MTRLLIFAMLLAGVAPAHSDEPFSLITLRVRAHLMRSVANPRLQTTLTEKQLRAIFEEVNVIWSQAGIRFELEAVDSLQAVEIPAKRWYVKDRNWVSKAIPTDYFSPTAVDVCFVQDMGPNGFVNANGFTEPVVVCEKPEFNRVSGGTKNIVARVTAHELGHILFLQHRQERTNLMASAKNGIKLNGQEIKDARKRALEILAQMPRR